MSISKCSDLEFKKVTLSSKRQKVELLSPMKKISKTKLFE